MPSSYCLGQHGSRASFECPAGILAEFTAGIHTNNDFRKDFTDLGESRSSLLMLSTFHKVTVVFTFAAFLSFFLCLYKSVFYKGPSFPHPLTPYSCRGLSLCLGAELGMEPNPGQLRSSVSQTSGLARR